MSAQRAYIYVLGLIALAGIIGSVVIAIEAPGVNTGGILAIAGAAVGALATMALGSLGRGQPTLPPEPLYARTPPPFRTVPAKVEEDTAVLPEEQPTESHSITPYPLRDTSP